MSVMKESHFKTLQHFKVEYSSSIFTLYESKTTGMHVVVVGQKGPNVYGRFVLATEIHDDSGAPHTLEHLCFMGSRSYSYKGFLDRLATRTYSSTNAWTSTDHTAYTLDTAGWEAFSQILPVYLEHILLPTLTDASCYTEVHHIDGTGSDAGVVYSEMQGLQNNQEELMGLKNQRLLYPEGVGFRYETGGMMEQLRVLTADRIRQFHREMYRPKNLCLVIVGEVDHENLLDVLEKFEDTIIEDVPKLDEPFTRPWVASNQAPALKRTFVRKVDFPEEDESKGEISVSFLGPNGLDNLLASALTIALTYLTESSASVLKNILVEKEQICSDVSVDSTTRPKTLIEFQISSVDTDNLEQVEKRFFEVLKDVVSKPLDMEYMHECIRRRKLLLTYYAEDNAVFFTDSIIADFLFDQRNGQGLREFATLKQFDELNSWSDATWRDFLSKWIVSAHHVTIFGVPSRKLSKKLKAGEEKRILEQRRTLGEDGLKKLQHKLLEAKAQNEREIPRELLEKFKIPGVESIHFIKTTTARSGSALKMGHPNNEIQKYIDTDDPNFPLFMHFEHIPSNFVQINIILSTSSIPVKLRPLLTLYMENFFTAPIMRNGKIVPFERVIVELEGDTIEYSIQPGTYIGNAEVGSIMLVVERAKYATAISWIKELIWNSVFDHERLLATAVRLLADIPEAKRDGSSMSLAVDSMLHLGRESIGRACGTLVKALYLRRIVYLLLNDPDPVVRQLEELREAIFRFENFRLLIIGDIEKLTNPVSSWKEFTKDLDSSKQLVPLEKRLDRLTEAGKKPGSMAYIVPMPTVDSSFAYTTASGISSYADPRLPALMVALAYLDAVEGPLWTAVRGSGLAYGTNFRQNMDSGLIAFNIYRSPDACKVLETSTKTIEDFANGVTPFDNLALEGAISSIVVRFANEQANMTAAATSSFVRQVVRDLPCDWNEQILKRVRDVSLEDVKSVLKEVVLPSLKPGTADIVVTCAPVLVERIKDGLERKGFKPVVQALSQFQDNYGLEPQGDEDEGWKRFKEEQAKDEDDEDDDEDEDDDDDEDEDDEDDDNIYEITDGSVMDDFED